MPKGQPELKKYVGKRVIVKMNADRTVTGILVGFDSFMNLSMHECNEEFENGETLPLGQCVLRGNSIKIVEAVDRVHASGN